MHIRVIRANHLKFLLDLADEFVYSATKAACELAKHRHADRLDVKDLQLHLGIQIYLVYH